MKHLEIIGRYRMVCNMHCPEVFFVACGDGLDPTSFFVKNVLEYSLEFKFHKKNLVRVDFHHANIDITTMDIATRVPCQRSEMLRLAEESS